MTSVRRLTAYEKNQLQKHGFDATSQEVLKKMGEMPVEYFIGKVNFCNNDFKIDKNVLIPRVETEELVEMVRKDIESSGASGKKDFNLVEVGTGSGAIGLSLVHFLESESWSYHLTATDISPKALKVAKSNYYSLFPNGISKGKIDFFENDLLEQFPQDIHPDYIIANLPYIPSKRLSRLDNSVKDFEPTLALDGGEDGFDLIGKLIKQAENILNPGGKLFLEVDDTHTTEFFKKYQAKWKIQHFKDQFEKNRFVAMELRS